MKLAPEHLLKLIEPVVEGLGYECVGIEYHAHLQHSLLRIYIDKEGGIVVDDCSKVSHQVSGLMEVEEPIKGIYQLEVSSPGTERPLFKLSHFQKYIGCNVKINLYKPVDNRRKITGKIVAVADQLVSVQAADKVFDIPFNSISKAHLVVDY